MSATTPERVTEPGVWVTDQLVQLCGCPNVARFLAQCLHWSKTNLVISRQGWFYKSRQEWRKEVWLSRYQQEKARQWLRDRKLLEERHERRQTGIRLWFRLDRMLLNKLLNNLAEQLEKEEKEKSKTEDYPDWVYDNALTEQSEINTTTVVNNDFCIDESMSVEEISTIVPIQAYKNSYMPKNGTIVSENISIYDSVNSDNYCIENDSVEIVEESPTVQPEDPAPASLSGLTIRSDNKTEVNIDRLDYDNAQWVEVVTHICNRALEIYPNADVDPLIEAVEGHVEYWMWAAKDNPYLKLTLGQLRAKFLQREKDFLTFLASRRNDPVSDDIQDAEWAPVDEIYNTHLPDYQHCHPFIYQYLKQQGFLSGESLAGFRQQGFWHPVVEQGLAHFVEHRGPAIVEDYRAMSVDCPELTPEDLVMAIQVSRGDA